MTRQKIVIVGGGFGGLNVAYGLRKCDADITLIDRRNFHLFQPLLYQVATGGLSPANIAAPLRGLLRRSKNVQVVLGEVSNIDPKQNRIFVGQQCYDYDFAVIAAGAKSSYFGNDSWEKFAPSLKSIEDATEIRGRVLNAFELAEKETDPQQRKFLMTFVIVGGGPTGVELAGAISGLANQTLQGDFRSIDPSDAKIILLDAGPRILAAFDPSLSKKACLALQKLKVEVQVDAKVVDITQRGVNLHIADQPQSTIQANTILWAAGVGAVGLAKVISEQSETQTDKAGRLMVNQDLSLGVYTNLFAIGDIAHAVDKAGKPLPGVAPVAIQQGKYLANMIRKNIPGGDRKPFIYSSPGNLATIGRSAAVAELGRYKFSGYFAWLVWAVVHILQISLMENRLLVFLQWGWNYVTRNRSARLITSSPTVQQTHTLPAIENGKKNAGV